MIALAEEYPHEVTHRIYGTSRNGLNLNALRIAKNLSERRDARRAVYISGSTHGNEYLNIEDRLARYFLENARDLPHFSNFIDKGGIVYVVPIVNPDGFSEGIRGNAHRVDLNRDFPMRLKNHEGLEEPESKALVDYLDADLERSHAQLVVTLDYHCCANALLRPWSFSGEQLPVAVIAAHQRVGTLMQGIFNGYRFGDTGEILHSERVGTSKDYFHERYGSLSFTFEGQARKENLNFPKHVAFWEEIFALR
jgi:predicted deacylase